MFKIGDESVEKISKISSGIVALVALVVLTVLLFGFVMNLDKKAYGDTITIKYEQQKTNFSYGDKSVAYPTINLVAKLYSMSDNSLKYSQIFDADSQPMLITQGNYMMYIEAPTFVQYDIQITYTNDSVYPFSVLGAFCLNLSDVSSITISVSKISQETWFNNSTTI